jgi:hypothetical protein
MPEVPRTTLICAALTAFALLRALAPALAADSPGPLAVALGEGRLAVARPTDGSTALTTYSLSDAGAILDHRVTVADCLTGLAHKPAGCFALAWSRHAAYLLAPDASAPRRFWHTDALLLQLAEVAVPGHPSPLVVALSAEVLADGHYRRSRLTLLDPSGKRPPRHLSPESGYNFWAVSVADVDADGSEEVGLCTYSYTARDPKYARRFFVYSWDADGDLYPRWRGSRLCRPYQSAALMPMNAVQLVSREIGLAGGTLLVSYTWNQFGFWGLGHTEEYPAIGAPQSADLRRDSRSELVALVRGRDGSCRAIAFGNDGERWSPVAQSAPVPPGSQIAVIPGPAGARVYLIPDEGDLAPSLLPLHAVTCTGGPQ